MPAHSRISPTSALAAPTARIALALFVAAPLGGCIVVLSGGERHYDHTSYSTSDSPKYKRIGVELDSIDAALAAQTGVSAEQACLINRVLIGSPAERAGLQRYDLITSVEGQTSGSLDSLHNALRQRQPGQTITLRILRAGQPMDVSVAVEETLNPPN